MLSQEIQTGKQPVKDDSFVYARVISYAGFLMAGVCFAVPGALMPSLLAQWSLGDAQAGSLLFLFSFGTMIGSFFSRGSLRQSLTRGAGFTAIGAALLPFASQGLVYPTMLLYGIGLGMVLSTISLMQAHLPKILCTAELTRLNLLWAIGACAGPWLILRSGTQARHTLLGLATTFVVIGAGAFLQRDIPLPANHILKKWSWPTVPVTLLILVFCAAGLESSCGGWLATYSQRSGHSLNVMIGAPTCLWAGLLVSRILHSSARVGRVTERFMLTLNLMVMTIAIAALLLLHSSVTMLLSAFLFGLAAGPVYPFLIALVFQHDRSNMIFIIAGVGSSLLPLLTGALSKATGSLRGGLVVPLLAGVMMSVAGWITAGRVHGATGRVR